MDIEGMEIIAIIVVIGLFLVVLKQFGIWEPMSLEGKTQSPETEKQLENQRFILWNNTFVSAQSFSHVFLAFSYL